MPPRRSCKPSKRVLIAFDNGASAHKAINYLAGKQEFQDLEVHLLSVTNPTSEAKQQLEDAANSLLATGYSVETTIQVGQPETILCEYIDKHDIDLLVMGAYGHSRIRNLIIGSTTTAMIRSCKISVLLFR